MGDDDDATMARTRQRHTENQEYEEPEEEEEEEEEEVENEEAENDENEDEIKIKREYSNEWEHGSDNEQEDHELFSDAFREREAKVSAEYEARRKAVVCSISSVTEYDYDSEEELWCKVKFALPVKYKRIDLTNLLTEVSEKSVIWEVPLIKRAITYVNQETQRLTLKTEGINFQEMYKFHKLLDLNRLYTNDVHKMAETFGIEAARRVIVKEIQDVFQVYGITVDPRHLLLVADYMTVSGKYDPFSRKEMEHNVSPLQQMSFEASVNFLRRAVTRGKRDDLQSPTSRLMVGQPVMGGTGMFNLFLKYSFSQF